MLADVIVLDGNPLDDIRNTNTMRFVMKNGELFDASDLDICLEEKPLPPFLYHDFGPPTATEHRQQKSARPGLSPFSH